MERHSVVALPVVKRTRHGHWKRLVERYLPIAPANSIWRYSRPLDVRDPTQGWKLHLSATLLNACKVLERVGPFLERERASFKAPALLDEVYRLNSGVHYSYTQVGKIITVYTRTDDELREFARMLHSLTLRLSSPKVPFDHRFSPRSNVYYRYGAFSSAGTSDENGLLIRTRKGKLVADRRDVAAPKWINDPLRVATISHRGEDHKGPSPLRRDYHVLRALSQRGKGGVYQAIDMTTDQPRLCLIKEGRKSGEVSWEGHDGKWRVKREKHVLKALRKLGIDVPMVYSSFELDHNYYLVTEFVSGETLHSFLLKRQRRLPLATTLRISLQLAALIHALHSAGWVWRDCKPANLLISQGKLRPLDFEGACEITDLKSISWATESFSKPDASSVADSVFYDDLYSFAAVTYLLITGRLPARDSIPVPAKNLRNKTPTDLSSLIQTLLTSSSHRFTANEIQRKLHDWL